MTNNKFRISRPKKWIYWLSHFFWRGCQCGLLIKQH